MTSFLFVSEQEVMMLWTRVFSSAVALMKISLMIGFSRFTFFATSSVKFAVVQQVWS
jgi:hypothetical protein